MVAVMTTTTTKIEVEAGTRFAPLWGDAMPAFVHAVWEDEGGDVMAEVTVSDATWGRVVAAEAFCSLPEAEEVGGPELIREGAPVRLVLRLREGALDPLPETGRAAAVAQGLATEGRFSPLVRQSEAWLLCTAMQRVPVPGDPDAWAELGMKTAWAR